MPPHLTPHHDPEPDRLRWAAEALVLLFGGVCFVLWLGSGLLLATAWTWGGRLFALAALAGLPGLVLLVTAPLLPRPRRAVPGALAPIALALVALAGCVSLAPRGVPPPDAALQSVWLDGASFRRLSVANLVPEIDQLTLGAHLVRWVDPTVGGEKGARLHRMVRDTYLAQRSDLDRVALGSVLGDCYRDMIGLRPPGVHLWVQRPEIDQGGPIVLFLHGSLGSWLAYQEALRPFVESRGVAVVSPAFGVGDWRRPGGLETVQRARAWIGAQEDLADRPVLLVGLSNGGLGVTRALVADPDAFSAALYVSAVLEPRLMDEVAAAGVPVHILHGSEDARVPASLATGTAELLQREGLPVALTVAPGQDHFLFIDPDAPLFDALDAALAQAR